MSTRQEKQEAAAAFLKLIDVMASLAYPDEADVSQRCLDDRTLHTGPEYRAGSCGSCACEFTEKAQIAAIDYAHFAAVAGVE